MSQTLPGLRQGAMLDCWTLRLDHLHGLRAGTRLAACCELRLANGGSRAIRNASFVLGFTSRPTESIALRESLEGRCDSNNQQQGFHEHRSRIHTDLLISPQRAALVLRTIRTQDRDDLPNVRAGDMGSRQEGGVIPGALHSDPCFPSA